MNYPVIEPLEARIAPATLSILAPADSPKNEGDVDGTTTPFVFKVVLDAPAVADVTFKASTTNGTALAGTDYVSFTDEPFTILAGLTEVLVTVNVKQDLTVEASETFSVAISDVTGPVTVGTTTASATITNDDRHVSIVSSASQLEGDSGFADLAFTVTLSSVALVDVMVTYSTADGTADGADFTAAASQTVTILAGQTTAQIKVPIAGDTDAEANETFTVTLESATNAQVNADQKVSTGTILNDANLIISNASLLEGDSGTTDMVFTVTLEEALLTPATVLWATQNGTAVLAKDFGSGTSQLSGDLSFAAGETTKLITIPIIGDLGKESSETFKVHLSSATGAVITTADGVGTITDSDVAVAVTLAGVNVIEGDSGTKTAVFTFELSDGMAGQTITYHAKTRDGTATASATDPDGADYTAVDIVNGAFTPANNSERTFTVEVMLNGDTKFEASETFFLDVTDFSSNVFSPAATLAGVTTARGVIYNNDLHFISSREFEYVDEDGDLVNVKFSKGTPFFSFFGAFLNPGIVSFGTESSVGGKTLNRLTLVDATHSGADLAGANIRVTANPQFVDNTLSLGDGLAKVQSIIAGSQSSDRDVAGFVAGIKLGKVSIDGDLGRVIAGNPMVPGGITSLTVASLGKFPNFMDGGSSLVLGPIGTLNVTGDVEGSLKVVGGNFGKIGTLNIGGTLVGGIASNSGRISFTGSIGKATVGSISGGSGTNSGSISGFDEYTTRIGKMTVANGITGGSGAGSGRISTSLLGSVTAGSLTGGSAEKSGSVAALVMGAVTVNGLVQGGNGSSSGLIFSAGSMGRVSIAGSLVGGSGSTSGTIYAGSFLGSISVAGNLQGGAGEESGELLGTGQTSKLTKITVGTSLAGSGNIIGGAGKNSGAIRIVGNVGTLSVMGDIAFGVRDDGNAGNGVEVETKSADGSGGILIVGKVSNALIKGSIYGGSSAAASGLDLATTVINTGYFLASDLGAIVVEGDVLGGKNLGTGLANSGVIRADKSIRSAIIQGDLKGSESNNAIISAGKLLKSVLISGDMQFAELLAGYSADATAASPRGSADIDEQSPDAQIGTVQILGTLTASSIVAGVGSGVDGNFGTITNPDEILLGDKVGQSRVISRIAKVIIGSVGAAPVVPAGRTYGIHAEHVISVQLGGNIQPLESGPHNDHVELVPGSRIQISEV